MAVPYTLKRDSDVRQKMLVAIIILLLFLPFGILFGYSPLLATGLLFAGIYAVIIVLHPLWGTLAYILTLPFGALLNLPVTEDGFRISMVFLLTAFPLLMVRNLMTKGRDFLITPLSKVFHVLILSFFFVTVLSLVNSASITVALSEIQKLIYCFTGYFLIIFAIKDKKSLDLFVDCLLLSGLVIAVIGTIEGLTQTNIYVSSQYRSLFGADLPEAVLNIQEDRICGPVGDSNFHSHFMVTVFILAVYRFFNTQSRTLRLLLVSLALLCVFNIIGASARGAALAFLVTLCAFFWLIRMRGKWLIFSSAFILIIVALPLMIALVPDLLIERFYDFDVGGGTQTIETRIFKMDMAVKMFADHPLLGLGPNGFIIEFYRYAGFFPTTKSSPGTVLNTYLQVLSGFGIIGFIIFISIFGVLIRSMAYLTKALDGKYHFLSAALFAWLLGFCVFMMFDPALNRDMTWPPIALSVVLCSIYEKALNRRAIP